MARKAKSGWMIRFFDPSNYRNRFYRAHEEGVFATREAAVARAEAICAETLAACGVTERWDVIDLAAPGPQYRKPTGEVVTIYGRSYLRLECGHLANDGAVRDRKLCRHC